MLEKHQHTQKTKRVKEKEHRLHTTKETIKHTIPEIGFSKHEWVQANAGILRKKITKI